MKYDWCMMKIKSETDRRSHNNNKLFRQISWVELFFSLEREREKKKTMNLPDFYMTHKKKHLWLTCNNDNTK